MKRVYMVCGNGLVQLQSVKIYIEEGNAGREEVPFSRGIEFLDTASKTTGDRKLLNDYIAYVEQTRKATFVTGKAKAALIKEVKQKLSINEKSRQIAGE